MRLRRATLCVTACAAILVAGCSKERPENGEAVPTDHTGVGTLESPRSTPPPMPSVSTAARPANTVDVTVRNASNTPLSIRWVAAAGELREYKALAPGEEYVQPAIPGQEWKAVTPSGDEVSTFITPDVGGVWVVAVDSPAEEGGAPADQSPVSL